MGVFGPCLLQRLLEDLADKVYPQLQRLSERYSTLTYSEHEDESVDIDLGGNECG